MPIAYNEPDRIRRDVFDLCTNRLALNAQLPLVTARTVSRLDDDDPAQVRLQDQDPM
jgi:hypothetical protein